MLFTGLAPKTHCMITYLLTDDAKMVLTSPGGKGKSLAWREPRPKMKDSSLGGL